MSGCALCQAFLNFVNLKFFGFNWSPCKYPLKPLFPQISRPTVQQKLFWPQDFWRWWPILSCVIVCFHNTANYPVSKHPWSSLELWEKIFMTSITWKWHPLLLMGDRPRANDLLCPSRIGINTILCPFLVLAINVLLLLLVSVLRAFHMALKRCPHVSIDRK